MAYNNVETFIKQCEKTEEYNFEFECGVDEYIKLPTFERYFTYHATSKEAEDTVYKEGKQFAMNIREKKAYSMLADCDGSGKSGNFQLIHDIYYKLWGWKRNIDTFGYIKGDFFECSFGGETINSANSLLNNIVKYIISLEENKDLLEKKVGNVSIRYMIGMFADKECSEKFIQEMKRVENLEKYMNTYHTLGNFTLVPSGFNKWRGINKQINDYWDLSLQYLKKNGWSESFNYKGQNLKDYYRYINYFFLWDYLDESGDVIDLITDNKNIQSCYKFIHETLKIIRRRSCFMTLMLRLQSKLGEEKYNEFRNKVFCKDDSSYHGYDEVFNVIESTLKEAMLYNEVEDMLVSAQSICVK